MRDNDLTTALATLDWPKAIFQDGLFEDQPARGNRNLASVPYIELQPAVTYADHDSSSRTRRCAMSGRVVYLRGHHSPNMFRNDLEAILVAVSSNLAEWSIDAPARFTTRLDAMAFTVSYWETMAKT